MKKFTCTETILNVQHSATGATLTMYQGDTLTLPDGMVEAMCHHGWGTSPDFETGDRTPGATDLHPVFALPDHEVETFREGETYKTFKQTKRNVGVIKAQGTS